MKPVEELEHETGVLVGDGAHAQTALAFGLADVIPSNKAPCTANLVNGVLEESAAESIKGSNHTWRELKGTHGGGRQCIKHNIEKDRVPSGGEEESAPAR
jgi:hypothetical protein